GPSRSGAVRSTTTSSKGAAAMVSRASAAAAQTVTSCPRNRSAGSNCLRISGLGVSSRLFMGHPTEAKRAKVEGVGSFFLSPAGAGGRLTVDGEPRPVFDTSADTDLVPRRQGDHDTAGELVCGSAPDGLSTGPPEGKANLPRPSVHCSHFSWSALSRLAALCGS